MGSLEEIILAHLLIQPELLDQINIDKSLFSSQRRRLIFREIKKGNTDAVIIAEKLGDKDAFTYVSSLLDGVQKTSPDNLQLYVNQIKVKKIKIKLLRETEIQARAKDPDLKEIRKNLKELDNLNLNNNERPIDIETLGTFRKKEIAKREIIAQYHAEKEALTILAGKLKLGKSLYAIEMGICVASGREFIDFMVPKPRKVLLYQQEISEPAMKERIEKMLKDFDSPLLEDNFLIKNTVGNLIKVTDHSQKVQLFAEIEHCNPDLVIFDPYSTFHNKKENDEKEMSEVLDIFFEITKKFKCGVFLIHHFGKPSLAQRTGGHELRGHSVLGDRPDILILFNSLPEKYKNSPLPYPNNHYAELQFILRNDAAPDNLIIERDPETLWYRPYDLYGQLGRKILPEKVRNIIREHGGKILRKELMEELLEYASKRVALKALQEAKEKYFIESKALPGRGNPVELILKETEVF